MGPLPNGRYEDGSQDQCSHGSIFCEIAGVVVTTDEPDYGIIQSALSLLRSLERDHPPDDGTDDLPIAGFLLCHGCGYPLGLGCTNFGTDWKVRHEGNDVVLSEPFLMSASQTGNDIEARVPLAEYRRQIVSFAHEARRFYFANGPRHLDEGWLAINSRFWADFDERLKRAETADQSQT
jgi:hypothetical protein